MKRNTQFLLGINRMLKLHETMLKSVCGKYGLTVVETEIVSFLWNNPGKDTATDIVELRMLSKGCVSKAVESLIRKGCLIRTQDSSDRRIQHLQLTEKTASVTGEIDRLQEELWEILLSGFDSGEVSLFEQFMDRMFDNIRDASELTSSVSVQNSSLQL